jgi:hypothetical protein
MPIGLPTVNALAIHHHKMMHSLWLAAKIDIHCK